MSGLDRDPEASVDHAQLTVAQHAAAHHLENGAELDLSNGRGRVTQFDPLHDHAIIHFTETTDPNRIVHPDMPITLHDLLGEIDKGKIHLHSNTETPSPPPTTAAQFSEEIVEDARLRWAAITNNFDAL